ncbi:MAG: acyl transferase, partial [Flavobacteriales bacterium]|nr:acyl transferase [Flavobacteriales bacterium]
MHPPLPPPYQDLAERVFTAADTEAFNALALDLFRLHATHNPVYRGFLIGLGTKVEAVERVAEIPCLPIGLFRNHRVLLDGLEPAVTFTSSGTTGAVTSSHHVPWPSLYERSFLYSFEAVYGPVSEWRILALLPAYLERSGSSLVYMAEQLIARSGDPLSGTYL